MKKITDIIFSIFNKSAGRSRVISYFVVILVVVFSGGYFVLHQISKLSPQKILSPLATTTGAVPATGILYKNIQYGFNFFLPDSWKGYFVISDKWEGNVIGLKGDTLVEQGTVILIRNPQWTTQKQRQDIPIMVFTPTQWNSLLRGEFHIGAAPVNPTRLGFNTQYVFALPARYNYAFSTGREEVEKILEGNSLQIPQALTVPADEKTLLCGGVPNNSIERVRETTRLFINTPKDVYPDKNISDNFHTMHGNATAGYISNGGLPGYAFAGSPECWSTYIDFEGNGEVDLRVKSAVKDEPDYFVRFIVSSTQ